MSKFSDKCGRPQEYEYCGDKQIKQLNLDAAAIEQCIDDSYDRQSSQQSDL